MIPTFGEEKAVDQTESTTKNYIDVWNAVAVADVFKNQRVYYSFEVSRHCLIETAESVSRNSFCVRKHLKSYPEL